MTCIVISLKTFKRLHKGKMITGNCVDFNFHLELLYGFFGLMMDAVNDVGGFDHIAVLSLGPAVI